MESSGPYGLALFVTFVAVTLSLLGLRAVNKRIARNLVPGSYLGRGVKALGLILALFFIDNRMIKLGFWLPAMVIFQSILAGILWWLKGKPGGGFLLKAGFWIGFIYLIVTGVILPFTPIGVPRYQTQINHAAFGSLWLPFFMVFIIDHIFRYESLIGDTTRKSGYWSGIFFMFSWLSGLAHALDGTGSTTSSVKFHWITAVIGFALLAVHLKESWSHSRKRGWDAVSRQLWPSLTVLIPLATVAVGLSFWPYVKTYSHEYLTGEYNWTKEEAAKYLANPRTGIGTCSRSGSGMPAMFLGGGDYKYRSCGGDSGGCHYEVTSQWKNSAHHLSANPSYQRVIKLFIEEEGIEAARLCAGCHDPVPLISGEMVPGAKYPKEEPDGVTCVVCHSISPLPNTLENGFYRIIPQPDFFQSAMEWEGYMMVKDYKQEHIETWNDDRIRMPEVCATCHNLVIGGVALRATYYEWRDGPYGPGKKGHKPCIKCHMKESGIQLGTAKPYHDHEFKAANVAIPRLLGQSPESRRKNIADSLRLNLAFQERTADQVTLALTLTNFESGHAFPVAPKDLIEYWFEYSWEGPSKKMEWKPLSTESIFAETLYAEDGSKLIAHELWKVKRIEKEPDVLPKESLEFRYPVPAPEAGSSVRVRLMHRRNNLEYFPEHLSPHAKAFTEPLEIMGLREEY